MSDDSQHPFFTHGTLMQGEPNAHLLDGRVTSRAQATLTGARLLDQGYFPYLIRRADPTAVVTGEMVIVRVDAWRATLASLDRLEGFQPGRTDNHYERVVVTVRSADGQSAEAWTYVPSAALLPRLTAVPVVPSGNWRRRHEVTPKT